MKTFDQLTNSQKDEAISNARLIFRDLMQDPNIQLFGKSEEVTDETIGYYAKAAAEGSFYSESGDRIIDGIVG